VIENVWIREFDSAAFKWKLDKKGPAGISVENMRLLELMSTVQSNKGGLGEKAEKKVSEALLKIMGSASSLSYDDTSQYQTFFIAPKGASSSTGMDLTEINLHFLRILYNSPKLLKSKQVNFPTENFSLYRNYFINKALGARSVRTASYAL
jgi:hypothetical protein